MDELPPSINTLVIENGTIYVAPAYKVKDPIYCRAGEHVFGFERSQRKLSFLIRGNLLPKLSVEEGVAFAAEGAGVRIGYNFRPTWTLQNHTTAFVEMRGHDDEVDVVFQPGGEALIPITRGTDHVFTGRFAAHRAAGLIELRVHDHRREIIAIHKAEFDASFRGGTDPARYFQARLMLPSLPDAEFVSLLVRCRNRRGPDDLPGYIFIADLSLRIQDQAKPWPTRVLGSQANLGSAELFQCSVDPELVARTRADLVLSADGYELIIDASRATINAHARESSALVFSTNEPGTYLISVDGKFQSAVTLDDAPVAVPAVGNVFDGKSHRVLVRDALGLVALYRDDLFFRWDLASAAQLRRPCLIVADGTDDSEGRALLVISALRFAAPLLGPSAVRLINARTDAVIAAAELLAWETGVTTECRDAATEAASELAGAALFIAAAFRRTEHLTALLRAADELGIPHLVAVQFPDPHSAVSMLVNSRLAHDPRSFANEIVKILDVVAHDE